LCRVAVRESGNVRRLHALVRQGVGQWATGLMRGHPWFSPVVVRHGTARVLPPWRINASSTYAASHHAPPAALSLAMFRDLAVTLTQWPRTAGTAHSALRKGGDEGAACRPRFTSSMPLALRRARTDCVGRPAPSAVIPRRSTAAARPRGGPRKAGNRRLLPERAPRAHRRWPPGYR
jgi:hypothetical protein